jgi:hypothetical protein
MTLATNQHWPIRDPNARAYAPPFEPVRRLTPPSVTRRLDNNDDAPKPAEPRSSLSPASWAVIGVAWLLAWGGIGWYVSDNIDDAPDSRARVEWVAR